MLSMWNCANLFTQGGMGWMMLMGLFWIVLIVVIVYLVIKLLSDRTDNRSEKETPLELLQKEFARGNITEEEYLKRKKHLE